MSYASSAQFAVQTQGLDLDDVPDTDDGIQALLDRAAQDIDQYLRLDPPIVAVGDPVPVTRLDPATLDPWTRWCLMRATCAQGLYRITIGEQDLAEGRPHVTAAGPVQFAREAPDLVSSAAAVCLAGIPRFWSNASGCAPPPPPPPPAPWPSAA